jgi:hypothetical protein
MCWCKEKCVILSMLLQLDNTPKEKLDQLLAFAKEHEINLSLVDDVADNYYMPGKPLTDTQLTDLILQSRSSGIISLENAHAIIRKKYNAD